jgi:hypothetical protein
MLNAAGLTTGKGKPLHRQQHRVRTMGSQDLRTPDPGPSPSATARSASNGPPPNWASPLTRSTTGCASGRCPPAGAPADAGASPGTRQPRRSTGRKPPTRSGSNPCRPLDPWVWSSDEPVRRRRDGA